MTQEEKQLLLKDLCARLPYKPHIYIKNGKVDLDIDVVLNGTYINDWITLPSCQNITIKPYLRPMSSMTDEEKKEFDEVLKSCNNKVFTCADNQRRYNFFDAEQEDFMNAHHFDYRGLIEKGLALEAPEGMYKTE